MLRTSVGLLSACRIAGRTRLCMQKKQTANGYMANAGKVGNDEKWAHAAMEYIYEKHHVNDSRKRQHDVDYERSMSAALDRYNAVGERGFDRRMSRLLHRMTDALRAMGELGLSESGVLAEAVLLNSEQPPGSYRRPALTPPIMGYEPGFGLDVPQLKSQYTEYPPVRHVTDELEFGTDAEDHFPYVDAHRIEDLVTSCQAEVEELHGCVREAAPLTGIEGEAWESYMALQKKALARQRLILDLCNDPDLRERYDGDEVFRHDELTRRGIVPLTVEQDEVDELKRGGALATAAENDDDDDEDERHYAQVPAYEPFRVI